MTGAVLAGLAGGMAPGGGTITPTPTPNWTNIYDTDVGSTNAQTLTGFTAPISITASRTGNGKIYYSLNGGYALYTGAFTVNAGDVLVWTMTTLGINTGNVSGVLTVTNATASATLQAINYTVIDGRGL